MVIWARDPYYATTEILIFLAIFVPSLTHWQLFIGFNGESGTTLWRNNILTQIPGCAGFPVPISTHH
ncbi:MAG: hypothetical protein ACK58T_09605, partial [Phycisphaerae bacterium]